MVRYICKYKILELIKYIKRNALGKLIGYDII